MGEVGEALLFDDGDDANFGLFRVVCSRRRFVARGDTRLRPRMQDGRGTEEGDFWGGCHGKVMPWHGYLWVVLLTPPWGRRYQRL